MRVHSKCTGRASSMPVGIAAGVAFAMCISLVFGAVLAFLISREAIRQENMGYWIMPILFLASGAGSCLAYRKVKHQRILVFFLTAGGYLASLLFLTALFFGGQFEGFIPTALLIIGGSGTAFFLSGTRKQRKKIPEPVRRFR